MKPYGVVAQGQALEYLLRCSASDRRSAADALGRLAIQPDLKGKAQRQDEVGRALEVVAVSRFVITFWCDHSIRELRVVDIERAPRQGRRR